jgi:hypothetical protein
MVPTLHALSFNFPPNTDATAINHYGITLWDIKQVYFSPHCFGNAFKETFDYMGSDILTHPTTGFEL